MITDPTVGGEAAVTAPIVAALNRIIVAGTVGLSVVAGFATVPLVVGLDPLIHEAFHIGLPVGLLGYAAVTGLVLWRRRPIAGGDRWRRAATVDPGLARLARLVSCVMVIGWLVSFAAVLVDHHLSEPLALVRALAVDTPLILLIWILAASAWTTWCRVVLARADDLAAERLREYWRSVSAAAHGRVP